MKIVALRTYSLSCDPIIEPLRRLGHDVPEFTFFQPGVPFDHSALPGAIDAIGADLVFMLGQNDDGGGHVPPVEVLAAISEKRPLVHICCDGSEVVWWPQLDRYKAEVPRMYHVNIDGVATGFFDGFGWTTLCPLDHATFGVPSWNERPIAIGFCGGWGVKHPRGEDVERLLGKGLIEATKRPFPTYQGFREFMGSCKAVYNHAHSGTADHMHVKARVLETAFAGAVLVEPAGSPTARYFDADEDYLVYKDDADVATWRKIMERPDAGFWRMADRFREKAIDLYSAERFWPKVFAMVGVS